MWLKSPLLLIFFWFVYLRHLSTLFGVYCKLDGEYEGRCGCDLPPPPPPFVYLRHLSTLFDVHCKLDGQREGRCGWDPPPFYFVIVYMVG